MRTKDIDPKFHANGKPVDVQPNGTWCRINEDGSQTEYDASGKPKKDGYSPPPKV